MSFPTNPSRANALLRDLAAGFTQQMFFWGMDAAASSGNLFLESGFKKYPSPGLQGTSCYLLPWQGGHIFLHGACVGWLAENDDHGLIYIRTTEKCHLWLGSKPPVPGIWPRENLSSIDMLGDFHLLTPFLAWWLAHEAWITTKLGINYRKKCHRKYKSLPKSKPWLTPTDTISWINLFSENPATTPRAKHFSRRPSA